MLHPMTSTSVTSAADRRISARQRYHGPIAVRLQGGRAFVAYGLDLSVSGIAFRCDENLIPATRCELHFSVPLADGAPRTFTLNGVVVYAALAGAVNGFKVAVQFQGLSVQARELLTEYALQLR